MEYPSKRRRIERDWGGLVKGFTLNKGRERSVSSSGSVKSEKPIMPKLVLPPHGAPGHPAHGDQAVDASGQDAERPHYPLESADPKPSRVHARQLIQPSATDTAPPAHRTSEAVSTPSSPPTSGSDDKSYPGQVVPPAAVAAANARNEALESQQAQDQAQAQTQTQSQSQAQAQAVPVKQLDAVPQTPDLTPATHAAASASPKAIQIPDTSSQQVVKAPSTPLPLSPSPTPESSTSYFPSSPTSSTSPITQKSSTPSVPSPSTAPNKHDFTTSHNGTMSGESCVLILSASFCTDAIPVSATASSSVSSQSSESSIKSSFLLASATTSQSSIASTSSTMASVSSMTKSSASLQSPASSTSSERITSASASLATSSSAFPYSQFSSQASFTSAISSASSAGAGGNSNSAITAPTPSPSSSSSGSSAGNGAPPTQDLVGGIVGGVAGLAMIFIILLLLLRWRRGKLDKRRTISPPVPQTIGHGGLPQSGTMTERSSTAPIAGAGFFRSLRPTSSQTATTADTAPSERGFQKISGRKLPSVLASGGDGWGDPPATGSPAGPTGAAADLGLAAGVAKGRSPFDDPPPGQRPSPPQSLSGSSFYRDSHGFYGGVVPEEQTEASGSPGSSSSPTHFAPLGAAAGRSNVPLGRGSPNRRDEAAQIRPGPARTPIINQPGYGSVRGRAPPTPVRGTPPPFGLQPVRDGLGRSHPSQDGSRGSRFREDTTPP